MQIHIPNGHTWRVLSQRLMQWKWNAWLHTPVEMEQEQWFQSKNLQTQWSKSKRSSNRLLGCHLGNECVLKAKYPGLYIVIINKNSGSTSTTCDWGLVLCLSFRSLVGPKSTEYEPLLGTLFDIFSLQEWDRHSNMVPFLPRRRSLYSSANPCCPRLERFVG